MSIRFGTDGWRAVISEEFTFENVRKVAQAIADKTLADAESRRSRNGLSAAHTILSMVVGYDTRFLSDRYAMAVAEVLAANGIQVWFPLGDTATPVVSYAIVDKQANGGVMITASHNPPRYNGIKLKAAYGGSASPEDSKEIEKRVRENDEAGKEPQRIDFEAAVAAGTIRRFDPMLAYRQHLQVIVDFEAIRQADLCVAVDAMYGAGRLHLANLLREAGCRVLELRGETNPGFNGCHPEPIARHLEPLYEEMCTGQYQIGLATDGDADRIGAMDPGDHFSEPRFIDPHCIMALLLDYLVREHGLQGSVVKTVSTTQMLNHLAQRYNLPIHETPVGFNHISDLMQQEQVLIGGEESGGISIQGHIPEGDGLLMGLLLVEMVARRQRTLKQMMKELYTAPDVGPHHYARHDQPVRPFNKSTLVKSLTSDVPTTLASKVLDHVNDADGVKYVMVDGSWLLIRPSGTEPVLRIYAESRSDAEVQALLSEGAALAECHLEAMQTPAREVA